MGNKNKQKISMAAEAQGGIALRGAFFYQGIECKMNFKDCKIDENGNLEGSGNDFCGPFSIIGNIENGMCKFRKKYWNNAILYEGEFDENKPNRVNGEWEQENCSFNTNKFWLEIDNYM